MSRTLRIPAIICVLLTSCYAAVADRPNVLVLFSDQHRMASFPGEPYTDAVAPNLKRLAEQGIRFQHGISNYPVCSPFRAMLLTGKAPYVNGVIDNNVPMNEPHDAVANAFRADGYHTGYIGKWHLQEGKGNQLNEFGFDESIIWENTNSHNDSRYWDADAAQWVGTTEYNAFGMADQAVDFIHRNAESPFMLYVSFNPPHSNFLDAPEKYKRRFQNRTLQERPNVSTEMNAAYAEFSKNRWEEETHAGYLSHILALDDAIGAVLKQLEQSGLADNTIVIYTSDHGEMMLSHGRAGKRTPHEESINIPMLVRWPEKVQPGRRSEVLFGAIDIAPTLLALAKIPNEYTFQGHDISQHILTGADLDITYQPLMHIEKGNATLGDDHPAERFRGVRTDRYTYAVDDNGPWLMYDNLYDPYQLVNVVNLPELQEYRRYLHALTRHWLQNYQDPFPLQEN